MWLAIILLGISFASLTFGKKYEDTKRYRSPTTTTMPRKSELVVEKFVETLMASEKYLRMIESVERKLNHLDMSFHEKTTTILGDLSNLTVLVKKPKEDYLENSLKSLKDDLEKLQQSVTDKLDQPIMRDSPDQMYHHQNPKLESRLIAMEGQMKGILSGVENIVTTIAEVKTRQFSRTFGKAELSSSSTTDPMALINEFRRVVSEQRSRSCSCKNGVNRAEKMDRYPTDCHEIHMQGFNVSGIYKIKPDDMEPFYVLCDLTTAGGGWTVFQNRFDGSQDFYKTWSEYKYGFGNLAGEFWLGLEKMHYLTNQKLYELRVEMETQQGQEAYASFSVFTMGPEHEGYRISTLGIYYGTGGDSLAYHAGQKFSTFDSDNDEWKDGSCASEHGGAWWYKECDKSNLNGKYSMNTDEHSGQSIYWISFKGPNNPLAKTKMMIRPLPASRPSDLNHLRKASESVNVRTSLEKAMHEPNKGPYELSHPIRTSFRYSEPVGRNTDPFFTSYNK